VRTTALPLLSTFSLHLAVAIPLSLTLGNLYLSYERTFAVTARGGAMPRSADLAARQAGRRLALSLLRAVYQYTVILFCLVLKASAAPASRSVLRWKPLARQPCTCYWLFFCNTSCGRCSAWRLWRLAGRGAGSPLCISRWCGRGFRRRRHYLPTHLPCRGVTLETGLGAEEHGFTLAVSRIAALLLAYAAAAASPAGSGRYVLVPGVARLLLTLLLGTLIALLCGAATFAKTYGGAA